MASRVGATLLAVTLLGACGASATQSPATRSPASPSPAANADQALTDNVGAAVSEPYDEADVAALYATDATLYDKIANETSTGLEAIQAKYSRLAGVKFISKPTSAPIRQGDFVAFFEEHGDGGRAQASGLVLLQMKGGKVLNQWVYDAGPLPAASPPAANADQALADDLAAVMSNPYDAATVAALYAPNAVMHEMTDANVTSTGLEAIQARVEELTAGGFKVVVTSAPIRQGNFVAAFHKYGTGGDLSGRGLVVYELKDGKVLDQWVYQEP